MNLDFGASYVRVAETSNLNSVDTMLAVCGQKPLQALFKTLSNATALSRTYFGSTAASLQTRDFTLGSGHPRPGMATSTSTTWGCGVLPSSTQKPQSLVCSRCWESFFSVPEFQTFCRSANEGDGFQYTANIVELESSAASGCNWCCLVLSLKDDAEKRTLDKHHSPLLEIPVRFGAGPQGEIFTPQGNNRFGLWVNNASYFLTAFTTRDDPSSDIVTARELEHLVTSQLAVEQAKKWLRECRNHANCRMVSPTRLPSRVIEVCPETDPTTPRLFQSNAIVDYYIALSYCWGPNQTGLTLQSNLEARLERLNVDTLSRTIQDAILVTKKMGIRYLWVDAICIVQDSREDKYVELENMCNIYQGAFVTIVAANAANANQGFLKDRNPPRASTKIPFWGADGKLGTVSVRLEGWYDDGDEPTNKRAWTLQERLLSPRLLIYASHTLQYQCAQGIVNLGDSINLPSGLTAWRIPPPSTLQSVQAAGRAWEHIISVYSERELSYGEDKLTALAGVAEAFHQQTSVDYLAGLWSGDLLPRLLLWQARDYRPCPIYTAPSWSWASLDSPVFFSVLYSSDSFNWYDVDSLSPKVVLEPQKLPFGRITDAHLRLSARIRHGVFHPPQYVRWDSPPISSESPTHLDSAATVHLDDYPPTQERKVICLAIARRSYDLDGNEDLPVMIGTLAKSMFDSRRRGAWWSVIDGLIIAATGDGNSYRRVGCFFWGKRGGI